MRCRCYACNENDAGYCTCSNYVEITPEGECNMMWIRTEEPEPEEEALPFEEEVDNNV